jgi:hypothetical protein
VGNFRKRQRHRAAPLPSAPRRATLSGVALQNTYELVAHPDIRRALSSPGGPVEPQLTEGMLKSAIPDLIVEVLTKRQSGPRVVQVQLDRPTHEQALDEIYAAVERFGFQLGPAIVSELSSNATEAAVRSVIGDAAMEDPVVAFFVATAADVVGLFVSSEERKLQARYEANRLYFGWDLRQIQQQQQPSVQGHRPGFRAERALR